MAIYEVHLGSWRRGEAGRFLGYENELADELIAYAEDLGFTHLERNRSQSSCPRRCGIATQLGLFR